LRRRRTPRRTTTRGGTQTRQEPSASPRPYLRPPSSGRSALRGNGFQLLGRLAQLGFEVVARVEILEDGGHCTEARLRQVRPGSLSGGAIPGRCGSAPCFGEVGFGFLRQPLELRLQVGQLLALRPETVRCGLDFVAQGLELLLGFVGRGARGCLLILELRLEVLDQRLELRNLLAELGLGLLQLADAGSRRRALALVPGLEHHDPDAEPDDRCAENAREHDPCRRPTPSRHSTPPAETWESNSRCRAKKRDGPRKISTPREPSSRRLPRSRTRSRPQTRLARCLRAAREGERGWFARGRGSGTAR